MAVERCRVEKHIFLWTQRAEETYIAARCLYFNHFIDQSAHLGCFALELFLKVVLIYNDKEIIKSHKLISLEEECLNSNLIDYDDRLHKCLEHFNEWRDYSKYVEGGYQPRKTSFGIENIMELDYSVFTLIRRLDYKDPEWLEGNIPTIHRLLTSLKTKEKTRCKWLTLDNNSIDR